MMKGFKILSYLCLVAILFLLMDYQGSLLKTKFYVEPAENESLVFLQSEAFGRKSNGIESYYVEGIVPIYPFGFYVLASSLFENIF